MTATASLYVPPREAVDFRYYAERRLTTEKGQPLDFKNRAYLNDIYDCMAQNQVYKKSAQCGMSQYSVGRVIHDSEFIPMTWIYVLPTRSAVGEFSKARFNPIATNSKIRKYMEVDSTHLKQIGSSFIYFRGTKGEVEAFSVPADGLVIDEVDKCRPDTAASFNERLSASPFKFTIKLSTPTVPGYGIDQDWKKSDQREWFVRCEECGLWQILHFSHLDPDRLAFVCEKSTCKAVLDRTQGEWRATAKSVQGIVGFHPTQLICPWITPKDILDKQANNEFPADFHNFVLGEPYAGGTETVTRQDIIACLVDNVTPSRVRTMGLDWGNTSWWVIRAQGQIIDFGKFEGDTRTHPTQALELADKMKVGQMFMDFGFGDTKNKNIIDKRPSGTAWMVVYTKDGKDLYPKYNVDKSQVNVDRTRSLQLSMLEKKKGAVKICQGNELQKDFIDHYGALYEKYEKDDHGELHTFIENKSADHLAHADNYARIPEIKKPGLVPKMTQL